MTETKDDAVRFFTAWTRGDPEATTAEISVLVSEGDPHPGAFLEF
jgi:hypothetical protein